MELPRKVINRLHLGRSVAAEVAPRSPNSRAWVVVTPIVPEDAPVTVDSTWEWAEARLSGNEPSSFIQGYRIVRIELPVSVVERIRDDTLPEGTATVEKRIVERDVDIGPAIASWLTDASALRHPGNVADVSIVLFRLGRRVY